MTENDEDEGGFEGYGPLPTDAASFETYLKAVNEEEYATGVTIQNVQSVEGGYTVEMTGDNDIISDIIKDRHYLTERKSWFVSAVYGEGAVAGLNVVFEGTMRTMGDAVDVSDEMDVVMWAGVGSPPASILQAFEARFQERSLRQWMDDIRYAVRKMQDMPEAAVSQAMTGQEHWLLEAVTDLNTMISRNVT